MVPTIFLRDFIEAGKGGFTEATGVISIISGFELLSVTTSGFSSLGFCSIVLSVDKAMLGFTSTIAGLPVEDVSDFEGSLTFELPPLTFGFKLEIPNSEDAKVILVCSFPETSFPELAAFCFA